jgi:hypothetical protein
MVQMNALRRWFTSGTSAAGALTMLCASVVLAQSGPADTLCICSTTSLCAATITCAETNCSCCREGSNPWACTCCTTMFNCLTNLPRGWTCSDITRSTPR